MKWKCKDGRELDIKDMETNHLKNAIAMLRRKGVVTTDEYLSCLAYACSGDTPDGAAMAAEAEVDRMKPWKGLEVMEVELQSRANARLTGPQREAHRNNEGRDHE